MTVKIFAPHPLLRGGHLQTIFGNFATKEITLLPDEVIIAKTRENSIDINLNYPKTSNLRTPIAVLIDTDANEASGYNLARRAKKILELGVRTARIRIKYPDHFWTANSSEPTILLKKSLIEIWRRFQYAQISLIATSISATVAIKLLGSRSPITQQIPNLASALLVCPILSPKVNGKSLQKRFFDALYRRWISEYLQLMKSTAIPRIDWKHADSNQYMNSQVIRNITVPTTILATADDPINNINELLKIPFNDNISICVEKSGGHAGFITVKTHGNDRFWLDSCIVRWLQQSCSKIENTPETLKLKSS